MGEEEHEEAGGRIHRRDHRAAGQAHGPRRRDHLGRQGHGAGETGGDGSLRHQSDAQPRRNGQDPKIRTEVARYPLLETLPYAATIFLSSFLLFLVQPIIAKQILPWFGGSAGVWTTCLVFFQSILLAGYAYADWTTRLGPRRQALLHVGLLALSLLSLPILASSGWKPQGDDRAAVLPALHHHAAPAGVVLAAVSQRRALPAVRAFEPGIAHRAFGFPGPVRAGVRLEGAGMGLVIPLCRVRASVRGDRLAIDERF